MTGSNAPTDAGPTIAGDPPAAILVVEDDPLVRSYMTAVLDGRHRVLEAASGHEAMSLFAAQRARIVAVVMDHTLPNASGLEIAAKMRATSPTLPIILTSGHQNPAIPPDLADRHTVFLQKPFLPDQLLDHLQRLIG